MPSRRVTVLVGALAASAVAGAVGAYAVVTRPALVAERPAAGALVASRNPAIVVSARNGSALEQVSATLDGRRVVTRTTDGAILLATGSLAQGTHRVHVAARLPDPFGGRVARDWSFVVDTVAPPLTLVTPHGHWSPNGLLAGRTQPGADVELTWPGGAARPVVGADGSFGWTLPVPPGRSQITLTARDAAGNTRRLTRLLGVDRDPPAVTRPQWPSLIRSTSSPVLALAATDLSPLTATVTLDGQSFRADRVRGGFQLRFHDLAQGMHAIGVAVADRAGHVVRLNHSLLIDSTETLTGGLTLMPGARGADVASLTRRLRLEGVWHGRNASVYDARVAAAVRRYQQRHGMPADGVARPALLLQTQGKIVIVKHEFRLRAYRDGRLVATFPVAIGQPAYPSPTGTFVVTEMLKNPTWIPPNSPWAKGLEPIPPGSGNPLGTRWIGTSAPAVGIHGTPQDATIGTAASHGCIRMHIPDVERLFEMVDVGETVQFLP